MLSARIDFYRRADIKAINWLHSQNIFVVIMTFFRNKALNTILLILSLRKEIIACETLFARWVKFLKNLAIYYTSNKKLLNLYKII